MKAYPQVQKNSLTTRAVVMTSVTSPSKNVILNERSKTGVGESGADMGACAMLPRLIGQGRAAELFYTGRTMTAQEGLSWGFFNALYETDDVLGEAQKLATQIASGPMFAHSMTKKALHQEWSMGVDEAIEAEAQAQAICMATKDFRRAYEAFAAKQKPVFQGD